MGGGAADDLAIAFDPGVGFEFSGGISAGAEAQGGIVAAVGQQPSRRQRLGQAACPRDVSRGSLDGVHVILRIFGGRDLSDPPVGKSAMKRGKGNDPEEQTRPNEQGQRFEEDSLVVALKGEKLFQANQQGRPNLPAEADSAD